jgi:ABC-type transporter Mla subunit MlaD
VDLYPCAKHVPVHLQHIVLADFIRLLDRSHPEILCLLPTGKSNLVQKMRAGNVSGSLSDTGSYLAIDMPILLAKRGLLRLTQPL